MQTGNVERVSTDPATQFRAAIAQNAAAYLDLALPESIAAGRTCRSLLRGMSIVSTENTGWEIWLFKRKTTGAELITASNFIGYWTFVAGGALRIAGAGLYYYYVDGLAVPYYADDLKNDGSGQVDNDQRRRLHMALVARESAKSANDAGAVQVNFVLEATLGW